MSSPALPWMRSSSLPPRIRSSPRSPCRTSIAGPAVTRSSSAPPRIWSAPALPASQSSPALPLTASLPSPPQIVSLPPLPAIVSLPPRPTITSFPLVPREPVVAGRAGDGRHLAVAGAGGMLERCVAVALPPPLRDTVCPVNTERRRRAVGGRRGHLGRVPGRRPRTCGSSSGSSWWRRRAVAELPRVRRDGAERAVEPRRVERCRGARAADLHGELGDGRLVGRDRDRARVARGRRRRPSALPREAIGVILSAARSRRRPVFPEA